MKDTVSSLAGIKLSDDEIMACDNTPTEWQTATDSRQTEEMQR